LTITRGNQSLNCAVNDVGFDGAVLDFFGGSGTTMHAVLDRNRDVENGARLTFLLIEQGNHFHEVILPRMKKVAFSNHWSDGQAQAGTGCSLFVKYFAFEQYEDSLGSAAYSEEKDLFTNTKTDRYSQYVFFRDLKMAEALELDYEKDEVNVHLDRLYPDIDLAETLSCITGKWIKRITAEEVEFTDGSKQSLKKPDWRLLKPLIFWGPVV